MIGGGLMPRIKARLAPEIRVKMNIRIVRTALVYTHQAVVLI